MSTVVLSYSILQARAVHIGFPFWASFLYPIGLDALILGASRTWQDANLTAGTRRLAQWMTMAAILAGIAAFVAEFIAYGWEAVAFAILIPAALAASLVLTSRAAADRRQATTLPDAPRPDDDVRLISAPSRVYAASSPRAGKTIHAVVEDSAPSDDARRAEPYDIDVRRAWVRDQLVAGRALTGADVDRQFSGARNGARLVRQVREQLAREATNGK